MTKTNGNTNILTKEQEEQRKQIVDLELKARYWEAQWKIRFYTLESEKLQGDYDAYIEAQRKQQEEAFARFKEEVEKIQAEKGEEGIKQEVLTELKSV